MLPSAGVGVVSAGLLLLTMSAVPSPRGVSADTSSSASAKKSIGCFTMCKARIPSAACLCEYQFFSRKRSPGLLGTRMATGYNKLMGDSEPTFSESMRQRNSGFLTNVWSLFPEDVVQYAAAAGSHPAGKYQLHGSEDAENKIREIYTAAAGAMKAADDSDGEGLGHRL